jgi:hypothetical protein
MSLKAKRLLKQAVKAFLEEDGASDIGAYRDCVTDILHLAYKEARAKITKPAKATLDYLNNFICAMGFEAFQEELENAEVNKVDKIPDKKLPLHTADEFQFPVAKNQFEERLKTGKKIHKYSLRKATRILSIGRMRAR